MILAPTSPLSSKGLYIIHTSTWHLLKSQRHNQIWTQDFSTTWQTLAGYSLSQWREHLSGWGSQTPRVINNTFTSISNPSPSASPICPFHQYCYILAQCFSTSVLLALGTGQFSAKWDYLHILEHLVALSHLLLPPSHYDHPKHLHTFSQLKNYNNLQNWSIYRYSVPPLLVFSNA